MYAVKFRSKGFVMLIQTTELSKPQNPVFDIMVLCNAADLSYMPEIVVGPGSP